MIKVKVQEWVRVFLFKDHEKEIPGELVPYFTLDPLLKKTRSRHYESARRSVTLVIEQTNKNIWQKEGSQGKGK